MHWCYANKITESGSMQCQAYIQDGEWMMKTIRNGLRIMVLQRLIYELNKKISAQKFKKNSRKSNGLL